MTRAMTAAFGSVVLGITYYGALSHASLVSFILDTGRPATLIRASLAVLICLYCFNERLRTPLTKHVLLAISLGLFYIGLTGLATTQPEEIFNYSILPMDIFFAIEGGVIALLVSLEQSVAAPKPAGLQPRSKKTPALST